MRRMTLPLIVVASLGTSVPAMAQGSFEDIVSGMAKTLLTQEMDRTAFAEAQSANTEAGYRTYLNRFPNGLNRAQAEAALRRLGVGVPVVQPDPATPRPVTPPVQSAAAGEAQIGLSRARRIEVQRQLTRIGYDAGLADGLWGMNTRRAITRWQAANDLPATGYVTLQQVRLIERQAGPAPGANPVAAAPEDDRIEEQLLSLTSEERREVQRRLSLLGYSTAGVDGVFGRATRSALAAWQRDEGLRATGYITADQLRELRRQTG